MEKIKKCIPVLILCPFIIGSVGYIYGGEAFTDALYASFALYFVNPVSDVYNVLVDIARWTAALVTTAAVLYVLRTAFARVFSFTKGLGNDSVVVYTDSDIKIRFEDGKRPIYAGKELVRTAKSQIIIFGKDADSFKFYSDHKDKLQNKQVYIGVKEIDSYLASTNTAKDKNIQFFDISESIARNLWKNIALWNGKQGLTIDISILGMGHLGRCILSSGLLMNLFSIDQCINYHVIGENDYYLREHEDFSTGNRDIIDYYKKDSDEGWNAIRHSDIIICSEEISMDELLMMDRICAKGHIFYYSPNKNDLKRYVSGNHYEPFGDDEELYSDRNILKMNLIKEAIDQNYEYIKENGGTDKSPEEEWMELDGFYKWSNITSSDYRAVIKSLKSKGVREEDLARLEHIRWCRFHYLNHWKYGEVKDAGKKEHNYLVDYDLLDEDVKEKNRKLVRLTEA